MDDAATTWRSGRAFPVSLLVSARLTGALGTLVALALVGSVLAPLAQGEEARFRLFGEERVASREDPAPAVPFLLVALAFGLLFAGAALLVERENRRGPATWTAAPEGLVRRRGDEVRTIPWRRFSHVEAVRTSRTRGHVHLWKARSLLLVSVGGLRAHEGWVWTFHRALVIPDVEDPASVAALLRRHLR